MNKTRRNAARKRRRLRAEVDRVNAFLRANPGTRYAGHIGHIGVPDRSVACFRYSEVRFVSTRHAQVKCAGDPDWRTLGTTL